MNDLFKPKEQEERDLLEEPKVETFPEQEKADSEKFFAMYENITSNNVEWLIKKDLVPVYMDFEIFHKKNKIGARDYFLGIAFRYDKKGDLESSDVYFSEGWRKPSWFRREKRHFDLMEKYCAYLTDKQIEPLFFKTKEEMLYYGHYKPRDRNIMVQKDLIFELEFATNIYANIRYNSEKETTYKVLNTEACFLKKGLKFFEKGEYEEYAFLPKEVAYERSLEDAKDFNLMKVVRQELKKR